MAYSKKQKTKIIDTICERVSHGEALRTILLEKKMIDKKTFYQWLDADTKKAVQYTRATEERATMMTEDMLDICDEDCNYTYKDENGNEITRTDNAKIQQNKLRVDTRKWLASKMNAKKYGDTTKHKISGDEDDDTPIKIIGTIIK